MHKNIVVQNLTAEATDVLGEIAAQTEHYSGADLQAIMNTAQLSAVHDIIDAVRTLGIPSMHPPMWLRGGYKWTTQAHACPRVSWVY